MFPMAVSEWSLLALALALTLSGCVGAGALRGFGRAPAIVACLASGALVTPAVVFAGFRLAGGTVGSGQTRIAFFAGWLFGIAVAAWLARVYARPEPPD